MKLVKLAAALILVSSVPGHAQSLSDTANSITQGWAGTATLGASAASGNSDASSISGDIRLGKTVGRWEHLIFGIIFKGSSTLIVEERDELGQVVLDDSGRPVRNIVKGSASDRLAFGYQPKFYWRPKTYLFGILDWESDEPANIDTSTRQIIGVGHKFWNNETGFLSGEVGFGNKNTDQVFGDDIDGGILYFGLGFVHRFNEFASFNADMRADSGSDNTYVELGLGLNFKVADGLALKISHFTRSNSDITDDSNPLSSSSDSITSLNLVIDI